MSEHPDPTDGALATTLPPPPLPAPTPLVTRPPRPRPTLPQLTLRQLGWLVVGAALTNIALRTGLAAVSSTVAVLVAAKVLLDVIAQPRRSALGLVLAAIVFAAWLPIRASTWLTSLNTAAVVFFLLAAATTARPGAMRLATNTIATLVSRLWLAWRFASVLVDAIAPLRGARASRLMPIIRGIAIAFLPVVVLTALLASADAVFAQSITTDLDPSSAFSHLALTAAAAVAIAALVAMTGEPTSGPFEERRPLGSTEAMVLLASIGALFAAFTAVQVLSAFGRADAILNEQGMTYAEYARSGFFQLLWVAALTLILLGIVRLLVETDSGALDNAVRLTGSVVALLTMFIVAIAIHRLGLYTDAFGQTTLRWYCTAFAWFLGAAFVAVAIGHWPRAERLLPAALLTLVAFTLLAVNILNAEARVAEHNLSRTDAVDSLDALYLSRLSADAWPVLLDHEQLVAAHLPASIELARECARADEAHGFGPLGFNIALYRLRCE